MIKLKDRSISSQPTQNRRPFQNSGPMATLSRVAIMASLSMLVWPACYATAQQRPAVALEAAAGWAGFDNGALMTKMSSTVNSTRIGTDVNSTTTDQHPALAEGFMIMPMVTITG